MKLMNKKGDKTYHWGWDILGITLCVFLLLTDYNSILTADGSRNALAPLFRILNRLGGKPYVYILLSLLLLYFLICFIKKMIRIYKDKESGDGEK